MPAVAREADILISAAGVLGSLTKEYVRPGQIVVDVSINWDGASWLRACPPPDCGR